MSNEKESRTAAGGVPVDAVVSCLPCPFCGGHKSVELYEERHGWFSVLCNIERGGCGARTGMAEDKEDPWEDWNNRVFQTPDSSLPPLGDGPRRKILVEIEVPENWESRLDMQWVLEREINADRWSWRWP